MIFLIPAIQSFFEILNYYAGLAFQVVSGIHTIFQYITSGLSFIYQFLAYIPPWMSFFALGTVAYYVIVFVIHPE